MKTPLRSLIFLASFSGGHKICPYTHWKVLLVGAGLSRPDPLYIHNPSGLKSEIPYAVLLKDDYTYISDKKKSTPKFGGVNRWFLRRRQIRTQPVSMLLSDALNEQGVRICSE
jgi:hypothetical protein